MQPSRLSPRKFKGEVWAIAGCHRAGHECGAYSSMATGWSIFVPIQSRQIVLLTLLAGLAATVGLLLLPGLDATPMGRAGPR